MFDPVIAVAEADKVLAFNDRLSELVASPVFATVMPTAPLVSVPLIAPVRLFCDVAKAKVGAVVPPIEAAVPVTAEVPEMPVAIAVSKLLLLATVLSLVIPVSVTTEASAVAVTAPVLVWLSICA